MKNLFGLLMLTVVFAGAAFSAQNAFAVTRTWDGGGATNNWSEPANWSGDTLPQGSDSAVFDATSAKDCLININIPQNLGVNFSMNAGYAGTVSMAAGISANFFSGNIASGTFTATDGTISFVLNPLNLTGGTFNAGSGTANLRVFSQSGGTFNGSTGDVTSENFANFEITGGTFNAPTGNLNIGGNLSVTGGTFNPNNGTINLTTGGNVGVSPLTVNNLTINKADNTGPTVFGTMRVLGTLTLVDGILNGGIIKAENAVNVSDTFGNPDPNYGGSGGSVLIQDGALPRTITLPAGVRLPNLHINDANVSVNTSGTGTIQTGSLLIEAVGTVDFGSNNLKVGYASSAPFTQNSGSVIFTSGNFTLNTGGTSFTLNGGTFTMGSGTADLSAGFNIVRINGGTFNAPSGLTTIGQNTAFGAFIQSGGIFNGNGTLDINFQFELYGGTFNAPPGNMFLGYNFIHDLGGTFNHSGGTVTFDGWHPSYSFIVRTNGGREVFNNVIFNHVLASGDATFDNSTFQINGFLQILNGRLNGNTAASLDARGDLIIGANADGGTAGVRFSGTGSQTFTSNGGLNTTGIWTIDKPSGVLTATTDLLLAANQPLNLTSGTLYLNDGSDLQSGALTIGAGGRLVNDSAATITLGGNVVNNGLVDLQGGGAACPENDTILLRSTAAGTRRNWSGSGNYRLVDVDVQDMGGISASNPAITVYSGTNSGNNNANWTFNNTCPLILSISPQISNLFTGNAQQFTASGGFTPRSFSIAVNNSGALINSTTGLYTAGQSGGVSDTIRVTDIFGNTAEATVNVFYPPTQLGFTVQPTNAVAGQPFNPTVQVSVQDQFGGTVLLATNQITLNLQNNACGGSINGQTVLNAVNGAATFTGIDIRRACAGYTLQATANGLTSAVSSSFDVSPAAASRLTFITQPGNSVILRPIVPPVQIAVEDDFGNRVTSAIRPISIVLENNPGGAALSGTTLRSPASGLATFDDLSLNQVAVGYSLRAATAGLPPMVSSSFNITRQAFFVTNTNDGGAGSLRQAIIDANSLPGADDIKFNIPGAGPYTIAPLSRLPAIVEEVSIDGTTQPGFNGTPIIEISGQNVGNNLWVGLWVSAGNCVVKGLVINRFDRNIFLEGVGNNTVIQGNYIGTDLTGTVGLGNSRYGIESRQNNVLIGGTTPAERNVISGNSNGIRLSRPAANNSIKGNYIGTSANGTSPVPNDVGIVVDASDNFIGGLNPGEANLIAFNSEFGINVGITSPFIPDDINNSIRANSIHSHNFAGITLGDQFSPLQNDPGDPDTGSNNRQNYPVLDFAISASGQTNVRGTLNSSPSSSFTIDFYSNDVCNASGNGEGKNYLGSIDVNTSASNLASFDANLPVAVPFGRFITATATDATGNTSEFSQCRVVSSSTVAISGFLRDSSNSPLRSRKVILRGAVNRETLTDNFGRYSFGNLPSGANYTVAPQSANYDFSPANRTYTNIGTSQINQNFVGTKNRASISGLLRGAFGNAAYPLAGVTVVLSGTQSGTFTGNNSYLFNNLPNGTYTLTPLKDGWTFNPPTIDVTLNGQDQNINLTATATTPLEGRIFYRSGASINADGTLGSSGVLNYCISTYPSAGTACTLAVDVDVSREGRRAVHKNRFSNSLDLVNADGSGRSVFVQGNASTSKPAWSPDSSKIAYYSDEQRRKGLFIKNSNGSGNTSFIGLPLTVKTVQEISWLDEDTVVFVGVNNAGLGRIYSVNTDGSGSALITAVDSNTSAKASPDGAKIAFIRSSGSPAVRKLMVMNADGTGQTVIRNDVLDNGIAWSPDGTRLLFIQPGNQSWSMASVNSANGGSLRLITNFPENAANHTIDGWTREYEFQTPTGTGVGLNTGRVDMIFNGVSSAGTTTVTPITPSSAGTAPNGFVLGNMAFEINTTAAYTAPVTICFNVPPAGYAATEAQFNALALLHNENGVLIDRTTSRDFAARRICGTVLTLSPFVLAEQINANLPSITGLAQDDNGNPLANVTVSLTGTDARITQTDDFGNFTFVNLTENGDYNVQPKLSGYIFTEYSRDFPALTGENTVVFTGAANRFQIGGRITDGSGNPVADTLVGLEGAASQTTTTNSNGEYVFTDLPADGDFTITPQDTDFGYLPNQIQINALAENATGLDFTQFSPTAANASISGKVMLSNGVGIRDATVTITGGLSQPLTSRTNSFGYYCFDDLPVGETYVLTVSSARYIFVQPTRVVTLNEHLADENFIAEER